MKFSTREDINAPIEAVFAAVSDIQFYERAAMRRGADVRRKHEPADGMLGTRWDIRFSAKGKERDVTCEITRCEPPFHLALDLRSRSVTGVVDCELFPLARSRTRMVLSVEVRPVSLSARLFIQSLRLTKTKHARQFKDRVAEYVAEIENRCRQID